MSETFKDRVVDVWKERRPDIRSVRKLEEEIGLSNGLIASWSKSEPSKEKVEKVANFFNVSVDYLLNRKNDEPNGKLDNSIDVNELLENDELLLSFQGKEISKQYRDAVLAILKTMPDLDENGKEK